jgi:hypothetical protein
MWKDAPTLKGFFRLKFRWAKLKPENVNSPRRNLGKNVEGCANPERVFQA